MDEKKLAEALATIVETLDKIAGELEANLGRQATDTIKEPLAKAHEIVAELRNES
jgi:hypothetical protein